MIDRSNLVDPFDVTLQCNHTEAFTSDRSPVIVKNRSLAAIRMDGLTIG